ncbi:WD repeat-containing protein 91 [Arctopsyche grandis]|uniref:WD repeat-containing protein 91 n=1 Tax=Arctopsyche grandis TaxID=121162 RepID=UPI00406D8268
MAHTQAVEELVREFLMFRGLSTTARSLETELRMDRDRGLRVDRLLEQLNATVAAHDLAGLRDLWSHLDSYIFNKLENHFAPVIKKFENGLLKYYLVTAVNAGKMEKVSEFLTKMAPELQLQSEWRDWFMLPYVCKPDENPIYSVYFTRQWQDTYLVSLHNFLATIFQCIPQPTLSSYETEAVLVKKLQEENFKLKERIVTLESSNNQGHQSRLTQHTEKSNAPTPLIDDFYIIPTENTEGAIREAKGLRGLIRQMGGSPVLGKKQMRSLSQN